jgi:hypothetical protein
MTDPHGEAVLSFAEAEEKIPVITIPQQDAF